MSNRTWVSIPTELNANPNSVVEQVHHFFPAVPVFRFETFYHPYVCEAIQHLNHGGLDELLGWPIKAGSPATQPIALKTDFVFEDPKQYHPDATTVDHDYPREIFDLGTDGRYPYSQYNWELLFHVPFLIACKLTQNQRFREAQKWFHYIFDPTDRSKFPEPSRFWKMRGFYDATEEIRSHGGKPPTLEQLVKSGKDLQEQVNIWMASPFQPHLIGKMRPIAYQKAVVMKYLDNLIAWADQLFRQDGLERINEATQLYILAADILGPKPQIITPVAQAADHKTFNQLAALASEALNDPLVDIENLVPADAPLGVETVTGVQILTSVATRADYFCIPPNDHLLQYWDTIANRLFNIRHGLNIEGVARPLPLFDPPIDPAVLVRAAAEGVDLTSVLSDLSAGIPLYRFGTMIQKATEICADVKSLGAALLAALEKRDAEALARLRSGHEIDLLKAVRLVKTSQLEEATRNQEAMDAGAALVAAKVTYYTNLIKGGTSGYERSQLDNMNAGLILQTYQLELESIVAILHLIPDTKIGVPTTIGVTYGGENAGQSLQAIASALGLGASLANAQGAMSGVQGGYQRRADEWAQQLLLAQDESAQIAKQQLAAQIRVDIAQKDLDNHDLQAKQAGEVADFLRDKFTSGQLYDWMVGQLSALYFQSYQLAFDLAKRAERAWQFERGDDTSHFVSFGYWDSLKSGLLSGERLHLDLKRMELAYLDQNRREMEITRHVSLAQLDPTALLKLRQAGECFVTLPESLYDADFPGHYLRRLKTVALSIPCVTGPYDNVNATLTLVSHGTRTTPVAGGLLPPTVGVPESIVTSSGQSDSGLFETPLRDERYLPFEGKGAVSSWRLSLATDTNTMDRDAIADVILHLRYTARDGGENFGNQVRTQMGLGSYAAGTGPADLRAQPQARLFSAAHDFADDWYAFLNQGTDVQPQTLTLAWTADRFPPPPRSKVIQVDAILVYLKSSPGSAHDDVQITLRGPKGTVIAQTLSFDDTAPQLLTNGRLDFSGKKEPSGTWTLQMTGIPASLGKGGGTSQLDPALVEDLGFLVFFSFV